jgi:hypothetical protein
LGCSGLFHVSHIFYNIVAADAADLTVVAALAGVPAAVVVTAVVVAEKRSFHPLRFLVD